MYAYLGKIVLPVSYKTPKRSFTYPKNRIVSKIISSIKSEDKAIKFASRQRRKIVSSGKNRTDVSSIEPMLLLFYFLTAAMFCNFRILYTENN